MNITSDLLTQLRQATPEARLNILQKRYEKNRRFFRRNFKSIDSFLQKTHCPYRIDVTSEFIEIIHEEIGVVSYEGISIDQLAEAMGEWHHEGWIDLVDFEIGMSEMSPYPLHNKVVRSFLEGMTEVCPKAMENLRQGRLSLKVLEDGIRFSPPVVFLGIFHGLHIARYLERTDLSTALFIEPDPEKFEVSCYFLDYETIEQRFGELNIYCGNEPRSFLIKTFFLDYYVSRHIWLRILPGYESTAFSAFVHNMKALFQESSSKVMIDREMKGLGSGLENIREGHKILSDRARPLSRNARIAVIASGPSLDNDIQWLKTNRRHLIVFAVHSVVRALRSHGIKPDFQFSLEMDKGREVAEMLELYKDVPLISYYKSGKAFFSTVDQVLLCSDRYKSNPIRFTTMLEDTQPSTTNLAFSFACFLRPAEIYLLGCDFGSVAGAESHARGTYHNAGDETGNEIVANDYGKHLVPANFVTTGTIVTEPFLNSARISVERAIQKIKGGIGVNNLSDGARIEGAVSVRSSDIQSFESHNPKESDIQKISSIFRKASQNDNWKNFPESGDQALSFFKKQMMKNLDLKEFSWRNSSECMDKAVRKSLHACNSRSPDDFRMEVFSQVLIDVFAVWYSFFILLEDSTDAEDVFSKGRLILEQVFEEIHWPSEFDKV